LKESLEICLRVEDDHRAAYILNHLGSVASLTAQVEQAEHYIEESVRLAHKVNDRRLIAYGLYDFGEFKYQEQHYSEALRLFQESLTTFEELGEQFGTFYGLTGLSKVHLALEDHASAKIYLHQALRQASEQNAIPQMMIALSSIANVLSEKEQTLAALTLAYFVSQDARSEQATK
ncbi:MAG: hypothetical protein AAF629_04870, partial [Chloroflexota bacterium]